MRIIYIAVLIFEFAYGDNLSTKFISLSTAHQELTTYPKVYDRNISKSIQKDEKLIDKLKKTLLAVASNSIYIDNRLLRQGILSIYNDLVKKNLSYSQLSVISPYPIFLSGPHDEKQLVLRDKVSFGHYNPLFLKWIYYQLFHLLSYEQLTDKTKVLFRSYFLAELSEYRDYYIYLITHPSFFDKLNHEYQACMNQEKSAIKQEPDGCFIYADLSVEDRYLNFWLRRYSDGTYKDIFMIIELLYDTYKYDK